MSSEPHERSRGQNRTIPRRGWALVIALAGLAAVALMIPDEVAASYGIPFEVFFWAVVAVQGIAAFGIVLVVVFAVTN